MNHVQFNFPPQSTIHGRMKFLINLPRFSLLTCLTGFHERFYISVLPRPPVAQGDFRISLLPTLMPIFIMQFTYYPVTLFRVPYNSFWRHVRLRASKKNTLLK